MSEYVPDHLKNERGKVIQNNATLRVDAAGPRVYAIGDIGTYSADVIPNILDGVPVLETNMKRDLLAAHSDPNAKPTGPDREFKQAEEGKEIQVVPVGRSKGVGIVFGWRVPSWFVWIIKGRDYMVPKGPSKIDGSEWAKESIWKGEKA